MNKEKIAIVTDSSSSLDYIKHEYDNIFMVRMPIYFGDKEYIDGKTITAEEFYTKLDTENVIPTTAQPSLGETLELYEYLRDQGYTDIIHLPISKGISGVYQTLFSISDSVDGINIHIVDTKATSVILAFIVLEAAKYIKENKSVNEVLEYCNYLSSNYKAYFMVNDLKYLIKNGRLSNAAGFIGSILKIKPILTFNENGEIIGIDKIRTTKKAMTHILERVLSETNGKKVKYFMAYGFEKELTEEFDNLVSQYIDINDAVRSLFPTVIGAHVGSSVISLGYFILRD
ncbi:MAG TPA: DegV family protein [Haloplasmataceae bacterium]